MHQVRRGSAAALIVVMLATACAALLPSAPAAAAVTPTLRLFAAETLAVNAEGSGQGTINRLRATLVIDHPPGVTVSQMRRRTQQGVGFTAYGAIEGTVQTVVGTDGAQSIVRAEWTPSTSSWGGCFTSSIRWCDRIAEVDVKMSDGTELGGDWTYRAQTEVQSSGNADPPTMYNNYDTTLNGDFVGSGTLRLHYRCDDNDGSGSSDDECDNVAIRVRNIATNATTLLQCSQSTVNCENPTKFNADDESERNGTIAVPTTTGRGRFTIEGMFCNEDQRDASILDCSSRGSGWQWMGSYTYNPGAPTSSFGTPSFTGGGTGIGGNLRPNTGASIVYPIVASDDAQLAFWDLDGNGTTDITDLGESGDAGAPVLSAAQLARTKSTVGLPEGSSCQVRAQVRDNGGLGVADLTSRLAGGIISPACTVNRQPTGAAQSGQDVTKGVAASIALASADGDSDPRTCQVVGTPVNGSVSLTGGSPATGCSASFTAAANTSGTASFQYRVLDDHAGVSPTYTVELDIVNRVPTSANQAVNVAPGSVTPLALGGSDPDGDTTTCASSTPSGGSLSSASSCTPSFTAPTTLGTYSFTYTRTDSVGGVSSPGTVTITVQSPDVAITKSHVGTFNDGEQGTYTIGVSNVGNAATSGSVTVVDDLPIGMTYASSSTVGSGFSCTPSLGGTRITCTRATALAAAGNVSFTVTVNLDEGASAGTNTATVSASPDHSSANNTATDPTSVNLRPEAFPVSVETQVDTQVAVTLAGADPEGGALTFNVGSPTSGSLSGSAPDLTFTPAAGSDVDATFTYTVTDPNGHTSFAATVTIKVIRPGTRGRVTADAGGLGIGGITVRLYVDGEGFSDIATETDGLGYWDLGDELPEGTYRVIFRDPGQDYVDEWYDDSLLRSSSTPIVVEDGGEVIANAGLATGSTINVTVTNSGPFTVALYNTGPVGASAYRSVTGVTGSVALRGLPAGTYYVSVADPSGALMTRWSGNVNDRAAAVAITLGSGSTANRGFTLQSPVSIAGTVTDDVGPLEGVTVQAYTSNGATFVKSAKTNAVGDYAIKGLTTGAYKLVYRDTSGEHPVVWYGGADSAASGDTVNVTTGEPQDADETLPLAATVTGTVTGGPTGTMPLAGAKVTLYRNGIAVKTYVADANGVYTATGLAAGEYLVLFTATGHRTEYNLDATKKADADPVTVEAGSTLTVDATLTAV